MNYPFAWLFDRWLGCREWWRTLLLVIREMDEYEQIDRDSRRGL